MAKAKFQRWEHTGMMEENQETQYGYIRVTSAKQQKMRSEKQWEGSDHVGVLQEF